MYVSFLYLRSMLFVMCNRFIILVRKTLTRGRTDHFNNISSYDFNHWPMILICDLDLDCVKMKHHNEYLGQRSFRSKVII